MKFLHTADLHIGKYVHDFSMLEDQEYILEQIFDISVREKVDALLIAGDVYDRSVPTAEAVKVLDAFLTKMLAAGITVIMISGNHDSPERVGFASHILEKQGLHIAGLYEGRLKKVALQDEFGKVNFLCMPYCKPGVLGVSTCEEAAALMLATGETDPRERNVLLTHYFVTDGVRQPLLSDSETMIHVGGLDNIEASLLSEFDYVALGHIHRPQQISDRPVYYAGSPLKYSFSEAAYDKYVNVVTLNSKNDMTVTKVKLKPLHEMRMLKGSLDQIMEAAEGRTDPDYVQVTLTDAIELYDPLGTLRSIYPNIMKLLFAGNTAGEGAEDGGRQAERNKSPLQLYQDFYREVRGKELDDERLHIVSEIMKEAEAEACAR